MEKEGGATVMVIWKEMLVDRASENGKQQMRSFRSERGQGGSRTKRVPNEGSIALFT